MRLSFDLHAAGVIAPGIGSLAALIAARRRGVAPEPAAVPALPNPASLPANERRRASRAVRLALACAEQALEDSPFAAASLRMVFASDEGTGEVCQQLLEALSTSRQVSPLLFHNSVHNAPSGYFSIAHGNRASATSVSLGAESFAAGLLCAVSESISTGDPVLLVAYDPEMTEPMNRLLPVERASATAWVIAPRAAGPADRPVVAGFDLHLAAAGGPGSGARASWLPRECAGNSSSQGLLALALVDDEAGCNAHDMRLGAQWLRLERVTPPQGAC